MIAKEFETTSGVRYPGEKLGGRAPPSGAVRYARGMDKETSEGLTIALALLIAAVVIYVVASGVRGMAKGTSAVKEAERAQQPDEPSVDVPIAARLQPSWPLVVIVAAIAGAAGAATMHALGDEKTLRKQVDVLRGQVDDVRDELARMRRGH